MIGAPLAGGHAGGGFCTVKLHPVSPDPSASLSWGRLPAVSAYAAMGLLSLWTASLKRSASNAWSMSLRDSAFEAPETLANTSNRSISSQFGHPDTFSGSTL